MSTFIRIICEPLSHCCAIVVFPHFFISCITQHLIAGSGFCYIHILVEAGGFVLPFILALMQPFNSSLLQSEYLPIFNADFSRSLIVLLNLIRKRSTVTQFFASFEYLSQFNDA